MTTLRQAQQVKLAAPAEWSAELGPAIPGVVAFCVHQRWHILVSADIGDPGWHVSVNPVCTNKPAMPETPELEWLPALERFMAGLRVPFVVVPASSPSSRIRHWHEAQYAPLPRA